MAISKLHNGAAVDILTKDELRAELSKTTLDWFQEQARGLSTARFDGQNTIATGAVSIPGNGGNKMGPKMGFAWAVQRISAQGLAPTDSVSVYRSAVTPHNFIGTIPGTTGILSFGSKTVILRGDENLVVAGSSLVAIGDIVVNGEAIEVPETDLFKLL